MVTLLREDEIKWYQRAKIRDVLEGDANTKYFQLVANGKHRKTRIFQLEQEGQLTSGDAQLKKYTTKFYKNLFGLPNNINMSLNEALIHDIPQVSEEENKILIEEFTESEVREVIFKMEHNKAPCLDGVTPLVLIMIINIEHAIIIYDHVVRNIINNLNRS